VAIQKGAPACGGLPLRPQFYDLAPRALQPHLCSAFPILPELHDCSEVACLVCPGGKVVLRIVAAVLIPALVASLGFVPMAVSTSRGWNAASTRDYRGRGLISATVLTLYVLPLLYGRLAPKIGALYKRT
jgi:hypothetical protein